MASMLWTTQSGYLTNGDLNKKFQKVAQPLMRFRQYCNVKEAFGKHKGESVNWLKVGNQSAYGGTIAETQTIPETEMTLDWGTLTVNEYGIAIPFSFKIDALSEFDIEELVNGALMDDCRKVIDGTCEREFNKTPLRYCGTSTTTHTFYTDTTCAGTNTSVLNTYHIDEMVAYLKDYNVPGFGNLEGDYSFIASPRTLKGIKAALTGIYQYTELGLRNIMAGEIGRYNGVRFIEDNFACSYVYSPAGSAAAITWTKGQSLPGYMFGSPTVREAIVVPEELRAKIPTDYGRSHGIAWYGLLGFAIEWDEYLSARILKWESNA